MTELFSFAIYYSYIYIYVYTHLNEDIFRGKSQWPESISDFCKWLEYISSHDVYTVCRIIFIINLLESFMCTNTENGKLFICSYYLWSQFGLWVISYMMVIMSTLVFFSLRLNVVLNHFYSEQYPDIGRVIWNKLWSIIKKKYSVCIYILSNVMLLTVFYIRCEPLTH